MTGYAEGGRIEPRPKDDDSIPCIIHRGEVYPLEDVKRYGLEALVKLRFESENE